MFTIWWNSQFDSARNLRIHLEAIQVLSDLNLLVKKAYISSDVNWFMDGKLIFHSLSNKLTNESVLRNIEQSLGSIHNGKAKKINGLIALELTGSGRIGLLSEVFGVLAELQYDVVDAKVWTHNGHFASLIYVEDCDSVSPIEDSKKFKSVQARLMSVLKADNNITNAKTFISYDVVHPDRRLHQMMFVDRDFQKNPIFKYTSETPLVTVQNWVEMGYSVVNV
ncbi:unnamed protein product [Lathyrus sativus]|nr:unnamed protein product [Lathyrus sativus]